MFKLSLQQNHLLLLALLACPVLLADAVDEEIDFLIKQVATSGCDFVRNGSNHGADAAADHLRLKHRRGRRYVASAEKFIDRLASRSSWTGKPYFIVCPETGEHTANAWLHAKLQSHRFIITESGQRLLTLAAGYLGPKGEPWITLSVPLGMFLPAGVALKVDEEERFDVPFKICTAKGCDAGNPLDEVLLKSMKSGLVARIAFLDGITRRQITVPVSLKGFAAAFRTLK